MPSRGLPARLTSFVGRGEEVHEVAGLLGHRRLLTLIGIGGGGKTRGHGPRGGRPASGWDSLTPAERQVVALIAEGRSNPEVAAALYMSRSTVKAHLSHIYGKLGVSNRTELAAHTTAMILRAFPATLRSVRPDWVLCCLGGNDVTRIGPTPAKCQVSLAESLANLSELRRLGAALTGGRWVWMTPATVDEERVAGFAPFGFGQSSWSTADVHALAAGIRDLGGPVVDLTKVFGEPAAPDLIGEDGVHPTLAGQAAIARVVIDTLAQDGR